MLLSNAHVQHAVGEFLLKYAGFGGIGQIGVQNHHIVVLPAQLHQSLAVAVPGSDFLYVCHLITPPIL